MPDDIAISVQHLTKMYGDVTGVNDVTFSVRKGEIFGFLGPNGAGKTTTIRLILDLLKATGGQIDIFGKPVLQNSIEVRRLCGYLPGSFTAYEQQTALEFLQFIASFRKTPAEAIEPLASRMRFSEKDLSKKIKQLSRGTLQKLGIIQAFFHDPELLILDEPTTGLDPLIQEALYDLIHERQQRGVTIFFSSHNLPEVEKICKQVAIIRDGKLVALESLEDLKKKRYRKLKFSLTEAVGNLRFPDAELIRQRDLTYEFLVRGNIKPLLEKLSQLPIDNVTLPEPDLEEIFRLYYESDENA